MALDCRYAFKAASFLFSGCWQIFWKQAKKTLSLAVLSFFMPTFGRENGKTPCGRAGFLYLILYIITFMTTSPINGEVNEIPSERKQQFIDCLNESMAYFIPELIP